MSLPTGADLRVLVAPDKFKGSATASAAASALARGLRSSGAHVVLRPVADGGEGTFDVLAEVGWVGHEVVASDAFGRPTSCRVGVSRTTAFVEMADVCRRPDRPTSHEAMRATTAGLAAPLLAAAGLGCEEVVVGVGGSASTDGGAGLLRALGARLLRRDGSTVDGVGEALAEVESIDLTGVVALPRLRFAVDVANPLTGATGAAQMFARQKGASASDVVALERSLMQLSALVVRTVGRDLSLVAGTGAGGGVAFLAMALLGAQVCSGADLVLDLLGVDALLDGVDAVVTGEGSWDAQTAQGKAPEALLRRARQRGKPVVVVAGRVEREDVPAGVVATLSLGDRAGSPDVARSAVLPLLEQAGHDVGELLRSGPAALRRAW